MLPTVAKIVFKDDVLSLISKHLSDGIVLLIVMTNPVITKVLIIPIPLIIRFIISVNPFAELIQCRIIQKCPQKGDRFSR